MKLLITRHGQAEDNVAGITMGQRDSALTPLGVEQAHNKALALKRLPYKIDCIYASDLGRCMQTAKIISDKLGSIEIIPDKRLREIGFGKYEGLPYDAIPKVEGGYMQKRFPGGESNEIMATRTIDAINYIYDASSKLCVLIMTHSGPISAILASYHNRDLREMLNEKINNEDIVKLQINNRLAYPAYKKEN